MRRLSLVPAILWIALAGVGGQAMAGESRQLSADGSESRAEAASAGTFRGADPESEANAPATPPKRAAQSKPTAAPQAGGGNRSTAPRWHSFLPGMFR